MEDTIFDQIKTLFENEKFSEAQELLVHIIEENANDDVAWAWYAYTFSEYKERLLKLKEGLEINPDSQTLQDSLYNSIEEEPATAQVFFRQLVSSQKLGVVKS